MCGLGALEHNAAGKTTANRAISARFAVVLRLITTLFFPSGPSREILSAAGRLLAAFFRGKNQTILQKRTFSLFSDITILKKPHENRAAKNFVRRNPDLRILYPINTILIFVRFLGRVPPASRRTAKIMPFSHLILLYNNLFLLSTLYFRRRFCAVSVVGERVEHYGEQVFVF